MKIALLDYGAGNVTSVERALRRLGAEPRRAKSPGDFAQAEAIILPGVGHYSALIRALEQQNLRLSLLDSIRRGVPFLGICLGLQALYASSEESSGLAGLSLFPGSVNSLPSTVKLPHMGWDQLQRTRPSRLLEDISSDSFFYFAHSFAAVESNGEAVATCYYGVNFAAVLEKENIFAVQFHPEKSGDPGAKLLENFLRLAAS